MSSCPCSIIVGNLQHPKHRDFSSLMRSSTDKSSRIHGQNSETTSWFFSHCVRNKALTLDIVLTSGKNQFTIPKTYEWVRISHRDNNRRCRMKKENLNQHKHAKNTQDLSDELRELNILCFTLSQLHPSRESSSSSHHLRAALFVASGAISLIRRWRTSAARWHHNSLKPDKSKWDSLAKSARYWVVLHEWNAYTTFVLLVDNEDIL